MIAHRYFADNVRDDYAAGQLDAQVLFFGPSNTIFSWSDEDMKVENVLQEMRELSICGGN